MLSSKAKKAIVFAAVLFVLTAVTVTVFAVSGYFERQPTDIESETWSSYQNAVAEKLSDNSEDLSKKIPVYYTGVHKKVIAEITIMASVRRGW